MLTEKQRFLLEKEIYRIAKNRLNEWDREAALASHDPEVIKVLDDMEDRYSEVPSKKNKKNDETKKPETLKEWETKKADDFSQRKNAVLTWLKNEVTKHSQIAYELWGISENASEEEKGAARSLFSKKFRGAKNDNGSEYSFTKQEINKMWRMMSRS